MAEADLGSSSSNANSPKKSPECKLAKIFPDLGSLILISPSSITYIPSAGACFLKTYSFDLYSLSCVRCAIFFSSFFNKFSNVKITEDCNINTETPAWAIDRLSILELKIFHMDVEANRSSADEKHRLSCISKLEILKAQRKNLSKAIDQLLDNISNGKTMALTYKQMKMYNDDKLNPELYKD